MQACAVDSGVEVLAAARKAQIHIIHVTLHSHTSNGSDLEYFKQRTIGDEHGKLKNQRNVPVRCLAALSSRLPLSYAQPKQR